MWLKLENEQYINTENGAQFGKQLDGETNTWLIFFVINSRSFTAHSGYATGEDAQTSLDQFMTEQGYEQVQPPQMEEEE